MAHPDLDHRHLVCTVDVDLILPAFRQVLWASDWKPKKGATAFNTPYIKLVLQPARSVGSSSQIWLYGYKAHQKAVQAMVNLENCYSDGLDLLPASDIRFMLKELSIFSGYSLKIHRQQGEGGQVWWSFEFGPQVYWVPAIRGGAGLNHLFTGYTQYEFIDLWFKDKVFRPYWQKLVFECSRGQGIRAAWFYECNPAEGKFYQDEAIIHTTLVPTSHMLFCVSAPDIIRATRVLGKDLVRCYVQPDTKQVVLCNPGTPFIFSLENVTNGKGLGEENATI